MPAPTPKIGDSIILDLPNERTMGVVKQVMKGARILYAQITKPTMVAYHRYGIGDVVGFRKTIGQFNDTLWIADSKLAYIPHVDIKPKQLAIGE